MNKNEMIALLVVECDENTFIEFYSDVMVNANTANVRIRHVGNWMFTSLFTRMTQTNYTTLFSSTRTSLPTLKIRRLSHSKAVIISTLWMYIMMSATLTMDLSISLIIMSIDIICMALTVPI